MVYQVNKSEDKEHSYLAIKEVKPNNKRVLSVISKSRGRSNGFSRTGGLGSFDLSKRRALSRSKRADSGELKSQKTTRTKKRSKSLEVRRSTHSRPLGIQVSMTKSSSNPEGNRSVTRERTRKNDSVRTRALSIDRPQSRRKIFSSERPSSRGRSRNPSRQNHVENNSSNEKVINSKPTEKETSMVLSSIQTSDSKNIEMPSLGDRSTSNDDDQLDSDILMKEKMKNATKSSCNAIDVSMLRVESSLATWAFSCSDTLQEFMTALPKRVGSFFKNDVSTRDQGEASIVSESETEQYVSTSVVSEEEREDNNVTRCGDADAREGSESRSDDGSVKSSFSFKKETDKKIQLV